MRVFFGKGWLGLGSAASGGPRGLGFKEACDTSRASSSSDACWSFGAKGGGSVFEVLWVHAQDPKLQQNRAGSCHGDQ